MELKIIRKLFCSLSIAAKQLKYIFSRVEFWIVIITLAAYFSIVLEDVRTYLCDSDLYVGLFSVFPLLIQERDHLFLILIGYLFLVSDVPEFYPGIDLQILRTSRNIWYYSQWIYLVLITMVYIVLIQMLELLFLFPRVELSMGWGSAVVDGRIFENINSGFLNYSPVTENFSTSLLLLLLSLVFAGICGVCNLMFRHAGLGVLLNALFLFGFLLYSSDGLSMGFLSPVEVYAGFNGSGIAGYISYYIILCTIIFAFGYYSLSRIDIGCRQ